MGPALSGGPGGRGVSCRVVSKGREVNACGERGSGGGLPLPRSPYPLKDRKVDKPVGPTGAPSPKPPGIFPFQSQILSSLSG
ncbi:unnamed protein product [Prunus armeniaca]|uniref:Uncharacterized protein n=1 Tax=Prunus armeniaca TaxID=36596 RepID=A0A6J5XF21_PRUAR|nr:unnamed protein product [Prunus armeniaca]